MRIATPIASFATLPTLLLLLTAGCATTPPAEPTPLGAGANALAEGAAFYQEHCAECHGADGESTADNPASPNLNSQGLLSIADDAFLNANMSRSRPGANAPESGFAEMDAFAQDYGGPLTSAQIESVVAHVRAWQTEQTINLPPYTAEGAASRGAATYQVCASCHGQQGWSEIAPSLAGATLQETASDSFLRHTILHGRPGTEMVGFDLQSPDVADLIQHVRALGTAAAPGPAATSAP